jgi:hypothetical protein
MLGAEIRQSSVVQLLGSIDVREQARHDERETEQAEKHADRQHDQRVRHPDAQNHQDEPDEHGRDSWEHV